jgi:6-phospho-3-hexuloisomerase
MTQAEEFILDRVRGSLATGQQEQRDFLMERILGSDKIFIYGVGRSGTACRAFAIRLVQLGLKVFFVGETITPIVERGDLVIIVSNTGETMSAIQTANIVGRLGANVVAITANRHSKLAHAASQVIHLNVQKDPKDKELAPLGTVFEVTAMVFMDGIISDLMVKMGQKESDMRARHAIWV